jgi:hypothetical protein
MSKSVNDVYIYDFMEVFDENTMKFVDSDWHHAYLSYFGLIPTQENNFADIEMSQQDIINIITKYGSHPPKGNKYYRPIPDDAIQTSLLEFERKKSSDKGNTSDLDEKVIGSLINVMTDRAKRFKEYNGRDMTYLEMRTLYG